MISENVKCVMVIDDTLPVGVTANTAAILGMTLGKTIPELVGPDVSDGDSAVHSGIVAVPIPVLADTPDGLHVLHTRLQEPGFADVHAVDFTELAKKCGTYDEYQTRMFSASAESLRYLGIALCGPKKKVEQLTGSLPLLKYLSFPEEGRRHRREKLHRA